MAESRTYRPPWWLRGRHLQTLWGPLVRRLKTPPLRRERWPTADGDFLDLDWLADGSGPVVIILHGLEGSSRSHYASGLLTELSEAGWRGVVLHFRSCSGELNRLPRLYHAGETSDLDCVVRGLIEREPVTPIGLIGVSLGGNVVLKWLGEWGADVPAQVGGAAAISTPFDLSACAGALDRGMNRRLYTSFFLRTMKAKVRAKAAMYGGLLDIPAALRARSFAIYDRLVTARLNGFSDEREYWMSSSSGRYLSRIRRPCLLINALNDPFLPPSSLPETAVSESPWLEAAFVPEGGHAGFLAGPLGGRSWAEQAAVAFLSRRAFSKR